MLENFPRFEDSHDGRLQIEFSVLVDSAHCVLHLLRCLALLSAGDLELGAFVGIVKVQADLGGIVQLLRAGQ